MTRSQLRRCIAYAGTLSSLKCTGRMWFGRSGELIYSRLKAIHSQALRELLFLSSR